MPQQTGRNPTAGRRSQMADRLPDQLHGIHGANDCLAELLVAHRATARVERHVVSREARHLLVARGELGLPPESLYVGRQEVTGE